MQNTTKPFSSAFFNTFGNINEQEKLLKLSWSGPLFYETFKTQIFRVPLQLVLER